MRAWAVVEAGKPLQEIEMPTPDPTGTEVLLEVTHCGVCHSDLHIWDGHYDLGGGKVLTLKDRGITLPLAMGHEIVGRVVKLGPDATGVNIGDRRIVFPWLGCGHCARCLAEEDNMCQFPNSLGIHQNGGYATHVMARHPRQLVDYGSLDPAVAATYACSGITVLGAIRKVMPLEPDEPIVLIGAGGLGLNAISILRAMGHRRIVVVDVSETKRRDALQAGASDVVDGTGEGVSQRIKDTCGGPVVAIIDLVNGTATAKAAFDSLRRGAKLVQVGLFGGEMTVPLVMVPNRALTIQGSYVGNPKELRELVGLAQTGDIKPLPVTRLPQREANEALTRLREGKVVGRVVLVSEGVG